MRLTIRLKVLIFTIAIIVVLLAVLHLTTTTLVSQNLDEQLKNRAELALTNVNIWFSDQKQQLLRQAEFLSNSPALRAALNDPNPLYMQQFESMEISSEVEMLLVENTQFDWIYQLCKNPADPGSRIKNRYDVHGERVWQSRGLAGFIPIRDGLVLAVTVPVGNERERLALLTLGDLLDQSNSEDLVFMSGTEFVHILSRDSFISTTLTREESDDFWHALPEEFELNKVYKVKMAGQTFVTMIQALYSPENEEVAYLAVQFSEEPNEVFLRNVTTTNVLVGLSAFAIFAGISIVFSGRLTTNLKRLVSNIAAMGEGDYTSRIDIQSSDEIGLLADAFENLRIKLGERTTQLLQANVDLDSRVHEIESLNNVLVAIASEQSLEEVFHTIANEASSQFSIDYAFLALRGAGEGNPLTVVAHHAFVNSISSYPLGAMDDGMINYLAGEDDPCLKEISGSSGFGDEQWLAERGIRSAWLLPIGSGPGYLGFLCLASMNLYSNDRQTREFLRKLSTEITIALQRFRLNEEVQLIEARLRRMFDSMRDGIIQTGPDGLISVYNQACDTMFGLSEKKHGMMIQELFEDDRDFESMLGQLKSSGYVSAFSARMKAADGGSFEAELSLTFTEGQEGERGIEGTIRDVTTRKKLEEELVRSERLASMGQIAASVAHEINNPLGIILGFTQDLISEKDDGNPDVEPLKTIEQETRRCARIVRDLLDLARADQAEKEIIDLHELIEKTMPLFKLHFRDENVETRLELGEVAPVEGDTKQIQQVLINIILNAVHAVSEAEGNITIRLFQEFSEELNAEAAVIAIMDNGHGIEPDNLDKVFDPFFTTKRAGGSGLGLFIVHRLIDAHGGLVDVESSKGEGTTFFIKLPVLENKQ